MVDVAAAPDDPVAGGGDEGTAKQDGPLDGRRERVDLPVVAPAISRTSVESDGRVGAVAYPYRVYEARVTMARPLLGDRIATVTASVDRSRRVALRADEFPEVETRTVADVLVLPSELGPSDCDEKAREAAFKWTLRKFSLTRAPDIEFERAVDAYKLFWLAERDGGDVLVDSVRGTERPLES
ncbi:hypothetical protein [Haloprofundus salinisoli]|uniref:hypothetical protein n=1 Tax=Haloprofundus salinisoli TaxID=2876193 RepID=UPI001CCB1876|nr:hypothetical protein [Haloprofundus salinisoli]